MIPIKKMKKTAIFKAVNNQSVINKKYLDEKSSQTDSQLLF